MCSVFCVAQLDTRDWIVFPSACVLQGLAHPCDSSGGAIARLQVDSAWMQFSFDQAGRLFEDGLIRTTTYGEPRPCCRLQLHAASMHMPLYITRFAAPRAVTQVRATQTAHTQSTMLTCILSRSRSWAAWPPATLSPFRAFDLPVIFALSSSG